METRVTVILEEAEAKALIELARIEKRHPRQQAAMIIRRELERHGLLQAEVDIVLHQAPQLPVDEDEADVLARVYALILSWPTAEEKAQKAMAKAAENV